MESLDGIEETAPMIHAAGGCAIIHSDDGLLIQRLNQEAGIAMTAAQHAGLAISRGEAIKWITANPARAMGRSEEHTSELQSLMRISYAVFCLKKKKK